MEQTLKTTHKNYNTAEFKNKERTFVIIARFEYKVVLILHPHVEVEYIYVDSKQFEICGNDTF